MSPRQILLVGTSELIPPAELPSILENDSDGNLKAEVTTKIHEAVERISTKGYDAVVCWAEREEELAGIIRIRKARPELPILLLTSQENPGFGDLAYRMGATQVTGKDEDLSNVSKVIRLALTTGELAREMRAQVQTGRLQTNKIRDLSRASPDKRLSKVLEDRFQDDEIRLGIIDQEDLADDPAVEGEDAIGRALDRSDLFKCRRAQVSGITGRVADLVRLQTC